MPHPAQATVVEREKLEPGTGYQSLLCQHPEL